MKNAKVSTAYTFDKKHFSRFEEKISRPSKHWTDILLAQQPACNYNVCMSELRFEWDKLKAESNKQKHGVSFDEAQTAFYDENARLRHDSEHSIDEERYVLLGMSSSLILLTNLTIPRFFFNSDLVHDPLRGARTGEDSYS